MKIQKYSDRKISALLNKSAIEIRYYDANGATVEHYDVKRTIGAVRKMLKKYRSEGKTIVYASVVDSFVYNLGVRHVNVETGEAVPHSQAFPAPEPWFWHVDNAK
jgi:hypothetical protein